MDDLTAGEALPHASAAHIDLPPRRTKRRVARRKAALVTAVRNGAIDLEEACRRYELSEEELPGSGELRPSMCPRCGSTGRKQTVIRPCSDTQSRDTEYCGGRNPGSLNPLMYFPQSFGA